MAKTPYKPGTPVRDDDDVKEREDEVLGTGDKAKDKTPEKDPREQKREEDNKKRDERIVKDMDDHGLSKTEAEEREYERQKMADGGQTTSPPLPKERMAPEQPPTPREGLPPTGGPNSASNPRFALNNPRQGLPDTDEPPPEMTTVDGLSVHDKTGAPTQSSEV